MKFQFKAAKTLKVFPRPLSRISYLMSDFPVCECGEGMSR